MASESRSAAGGGPPGPSQGQAGQQPHIGAYLAGQRKLRGISQRELAELTRIPIRSIERLEGGHFDSIDDGFVRGFVRTVSAALGLDPEDALTRMLPEPVGPNESPIFQRLALGRVLLVAGVLVVVAGSVGIVSAVVRPLPERQIEQPEGLRRRDPVRALALAQGAVGAPEEVVLAVQPAAVVPDPAAEEGEAPAPAAGSDVAPARSRSSVVSSAGDSPTGDSATGD